MKIFFDTTILVDVDRNKQDTINLLKNLVKEKHELVISTITVTEILTGSNLRRDSKESTLKAKAILNQFTWQEIDGETAEIAAKLLAQLIVEKKQESTEYPDVLIAASYFSAQCNTFITLNKKDFTLIPQLKNSVYTPEEFEKKYKNL